MFATDRDLLEMEPNLFRDAAWVGQRLVSGTGTIAGSTLTFTEQDVDLATAGVGGVGAGNIVLAGGVAYEVLARVSGSQLTISRLRPEGTTAALPPTPATNVPVSVHSMRPQLAVTHAQVLRMLGIEPAVAADARAGRPGEGSIVNPSALKRLECLGALHLVYAAVSAPAGSGSPWAERAEWYRLRFAEERGRAAALIDLDGDGRADVTRRCNIVQFVRG